MFACYVSKVFLEEEDSCECRSPREREAWPHTTPCLQHPGQSPAKPGREGDLGWPTGSSWWRRGGRDGGGLHSKRILGCDPEAQVSSAGSSTALHPLLLGSAPRRSCTRLPPTKHRPRPACSPTTLHPHLPRLAPFSGSSPAPLKDRPPSKLSIHLGFGPLWLSSCESRSP